MGCKARCVMSPWLSIYRQISYKHKIKGWWYWNNEHKSYNMADETILFTEDSVLLTE